MVAWGQIFLILWRDAYGKAFRAQGTQSGQDFEKKESDFSVNFSMH